MRACRLAGLSESVGTLSVSPKASNIQSVFVWWGPFCQRATNSPGHFLLTRRHQSIEPLCGSRHFNSFQEIARLRTFFARATVATRLLKSRLALPIACACASLEVHRPVKYFYRPLPLHRYPLNAAMMREGAKALWAESTIYTASSNSGTSWLFQTFIIFIDSSPSNFWHLSFWFSNP